MIKNPAIWVAIMIAGALLLLLINTTPLSRLGFSIQLPIGWKDTSTGAYNDASCSQRNTEGLPFAFRRPNATESCNNDINMLALTLNGAIGATIGLLYFINAERRWQTR